MRRRCPEAGGLSPRVTGPPSSAGCASARKRSRFRGSHALGDPAAVLPAWLRHATSDGARLKRGSVVTTGTWCALLMAGAEDAVEVAFDGIGSARLSF